MKHPLRVGLLVSAGVHAAVLGALLATRSAPSASAPMRVRMLSPPTPAAVAGGTGSPAAPSKGVAAASSPGDTASASAPHPARVRPRPAGGAAPEVGRASSTQPAAPSGPTLDSTGGSTVQDDIWVLTDGAQPEAVSPPSLSPAESGGAGAAPGPRGELSPDPRSGPGGSGPPSLLGELSRRLAWSAARCAPEGAVRSSRGGPPEVPLHFCLDAAGHPSAVGLEGTTGSELLDRAARECVVPGAAPLPALPGCYTVAIRFPLRG